MAGLGVGRASSGLASTLRLALAGLQRVEGVDQAFIATRDGLLVAALDEAADGIEMKAALAAALFGAVDRAAPSLELGPVRATLIETGSSSLQILGISELLLVVAAAKGTNVPQVRSAMAKAAQDLTRAHIRRTF